MLNTGQILQGRYQVTRQIAEGGQVSVFEATDLRLNRPVAIRVLKTQYLPPQDIPQVLQQFKQTCDLLAPINHQNVIKIYDNFVEKNIPCAITEFVPGQTLEDWAKQYPHGAPENIIITIGITLCQALTVLHRQKPAIIHRDIKPENIMRTPSGELKLIDFGIARMWSTGKMVDTIAIGTQGYAPPEQFGTSQTGPYSDVYSLGATLLYLATGFNPGPAQAMGNLPIASQINSSVSAGLSGVIAKATKPLIKDRFQSSSEFEQALRNIFQPHPHIPLVIATQRPPAPISLHPAPVIQAQPVSNFPPVNSPMPPVIKATAVQPMTNMVMIGLAAIIFLCGGGMLAGVLLYRQWGSMPVTPTVTTSTKPVALQPNTPTPTPIQTATALPTNIVTRTPQAATPIRATSTPMPTSTKVAQRVSQAGGGNDNNLPGRLANPPPVGQIPVSAPAPSQPDNPTLVGQIPLPASVPSPVTNINLGNNHFNILSTQSRQHTGVYAPLDSNVRINQIGGQWRNAPNSPYTGGNGYPEAGSWDTNPMPDHPPGMLMCWIGAVPIAVRQGIEFRNGAQGEIVCQMNDDRLDDNNGNLVIEIIISR